MSESSVAQAGIEYKNLQGTFRSVYAQVRTLIGQGWYLQGSMIEPNPNMDAGAAIVTLFRFNP